MGRRVRVSRWLVCFLALAIVGPASAARPAIAGQNEAGIVGQVTDESGAVLPGVTVTAISPALQLPQVVGVSNERGEYRLSPLPVGTYVVEYSLTGFQTIRREGLRLTVGFTARLDIILKVGTLAETVTVSGAAPVVDTASTSSATQLVREALELIPTSRNGYSGLLNQAPGTRGVIDVGGENFNSNPTFHAFGMDGESWQLLEGVVTTSAKASQTGNYSDYSSYEEAKIQTFGNDAEIPTRGVAINAVAKSGGNEFHGSAFAAYQNKRLQGSNIDAALIAQGVTSPETLNYRGDLSFEMGGPVIKNKIWFWGNERYRRGISNILGCLQPDGTACPDKQGQGFQTIKGTFQVNPSNKIIGFWQFNQKYNDTGATRLISWQTETLQRVHVWTPKAEWQGVRGNSLVFSVLTGGWRNYTNQYFFPGTEGLISTTDLVTGVQTGSSYTGGQRNQEQRWQTKGTVTWYKPDWLGGNHEFKMGLEHQLSWANRAMDDRGAAQNYQLQFRSGVPTQIQIGNFPVDPKEHIIYIGAFVQDSWVIGRRLTLNLGVRYAHDDGHILSTTSTAAIGLGATAFPAATLPFVQFPIFNPISPRLHFAYDVTGDGKTVVKGGWGRFHKMRFTDELQTVDRGVIANATYKWHDLNGDKLYEPGEVNLSTSGPDFVSTSLFGLGGALAGGVVNPNETEPYTDESSIQFERQLISNLAVRVTGAYAHAVNQYRLANSLRPYGAYTIPIIVPDPGPDGKLGTPDDTGKTITYYDYPASLAGAAFQAPTIVNDALANQTFKTVEFAIAKRLSNRWQFNAAYTYTWKNIPLVPNVGGGNSPSFNTQDPNAQIFPADTTPEWTTRISGSYLFPYGLQVSGNLDSRSGAPLARTASFANGARVGTLTLRVEPIGSEYLPNINLLDLRVEKRIDVGKGKRLAVQLNIYNATNINVATAVTVQSGASYGLTTAIISPRIAELSLRFTF
jgi:outer membrane receptor protein involved in Fe transport